jgi:hypothetical protein
MYFKTMAAQIKDEAEFLREQYPKLSNNFGTPYLADTLNRLYLEKVRTSWPTINDWILVHQARFASLVSNFQKTKKELSFEILGHLLSLQETQKRRDPEDFRGIFQPHFGWDRSTHRAQQIAYSSGRQQRSWTEKAIGDGLRFAGQETDRTFEGTIPGLRAFGRKEPQEIAKSSLAELLQTLLVSQNCIGEIGKVLKELLKERVQLSNGLVLVSRQTSRSFTRKP